MHELLISVEGYLKPILADGIVGFLRLFWYFAVVEFPRIVVLNLVVVTHRFMSRNRPRPARVLDYSVVVPVLNEGSTVGATLRSLEEQSHKPTEIILVDDGSTDDTAIICGAIAAASSRIKFMSQGDRSGKSAALNRGLAQVTQEIVVFVDSDTTFDRDAMRKLVERFDDPTVAAVGGSLRVRNRHENLLTEAQALEYGQSITLTRQVKSLFDILPIISGAFGGFRTRRVRAVGGHDPGPGNDSDLTIDLREQGGRIRFAYDAVCHTDVPTQVSKLTKQRRRWCRNVVKNRLRKHRSVLSPFHGKFALRNLISTLDPILYQVFIGWVWVAYVVYTFVTNSQLIVPIIIGNTMLYWIAGAAQQVVVVVLSERPHEDAWGMLFTPALHFYRVYTRLVMLYAQFEELLTRTSRRDPFAPAKVQRQMPDW